MRRSGTPRSVISRPRAVVASIAALAVVSAGCSAIDGGSEPEVVTLGADLALSGENSRLGEVYRNALELRVQQVNQQGLLGDRRLELEIRDNRTDPSTSASNVSELAGDDSVTALVTGGCPECLLDSLDTIESAEVPTIALASSENVSTPVAERHYIFRLGPSAFDSATAIVDELEELNAETVAVVADDDDYGQEGLREFTAAADRAGIEVVAEETVTDQEDVLQAAAEGVATYQPAPPEGLQLPGEPTEPDAVVLWSQAPRAELVAQHLRDTGFEGQLVLDMVAADSLFLSEQTASALAGATMVFTETFVIDEIIATSPAKTARQAWFNEYSARYGTYHAFASFAADAVELMVEAVNETGSTDRNALRDAIETTQFSGLTGPLRLSPQRHSGLMPQALTIVTAQGDRWRLAG